MKRAFLVLAILVAAQAVPAQIAPPAGGDGASGPGAWLSLTRGRTTYARGLYATAAVELSRATALRPEDPWPAFLAGRALLRIGRPAEAERMFRLALDRAGAAGPGGSFPAALCRAELGRALEEGGKPAEAERSYREALGQGIADPAVRVRWASVLIDLDRLEEAGEALESADSETPLDEEGRLVRMRLEAAKHRREGREEEAAPLEEELARAESAHQEASALVAQGRAGAARITERLRAGDPEGAREALHETLALEPRDANLLARLGSLAVSLGLRSEARSGYEASLAIDPANPGSLHGLGLMKVEDGLVMEGLDLLRAAARRDPDDWKVHDDLAALYLRLGRADEAVRELRLALARNPFYLPGYDGLTAIHAAYGEGRMASFYRSRRERVAAAATAASREANPGPQGEPGPQPAE